MGFIILDDKDKTEDRLHDFTEAREEFSKDQNDDYKKARVVGCGSLFVRDAPNGEIIDAIMEGTIVKMTGEKNGPWAHILYSENDKKEGWANMNYLEIIK